MRQKPTPPEALPVKDLKSESLEVEKACKTLAAGGVLLSETDTVYGLSCDAENEAAIARLLQAKGRPANRGLLLLLAEAGWAQRVARPPAGFSRLASRIWPGPVTLLLKARPRLPRSLKGKAGKVGCRVPGHAFLQAVLLRLGRPLVSSSANLSGHPAPEGFPELERLFRGRVDLILAGSRAIERSAPSTVLDLSGSTPVLIRAGAGIERVRRLLGESLLKTEQPLS